MDRTAPTRITAIDGLRGVSILLLVIGHWGANQSDPALAALEPLAGLGVSILLTLTGFVATLATLNRAEHGGEPLRAWLGRKAVRVYPTLVAVLAAASLMQLRNGEPVPIERYAGFLSLLGNYYYALAESDAFRHTLGHLWTLMVGAHFLLFWTPTLRTAHRRGSVQGLVPLVAAVTLGSAAVRHVYMATGVVPPAYAYLATEARLADIAAGAWLALLLWTGRDDLLRRAAPGVTGPLALIALPLSLLLPPWALLIPFRILLAAWIVWWLATNRTSPARSLLAARPLIWLSVISYSVFTWHRFALESERLVAGAPVLLSFPVSVVGTLVLCAAAWVVLERLPARIRSGWGAGT